MTIITGDTHREFRRVGALCDKIDSSADDLLIILGDAGINYFGGKEDVYLKQELSRLPITMLCIHGNHEQRPETLPNYIVTEWRGGSVYIEKEFPNLLFVKDGEIYEIDGKRCITIGGAYSIDKEVRLANNWGWWADEQPSDEIKQRVEQRLDIERWDVDVVLSHTAPLKYEPREAFLKGFEDSVADKSTEIWLDSIEDRLSYNKWYCGHYHINKTINKMRFLFEDFIEFK